MPTEPTTVVPTTNPKQPCHAPSSTPAHRGYAGHLKHTSGLTPKGNGAPPRGSYRK